MVLVMCYRGSSEQIGSASRLVTALANSVESEQAKKRNTQSRGTIPGRLKKSTVTSTRMADDHNAKTEVTGMLPTEYDDCYPALSLAQESSTLLGDTGKLEQAALMSAVHQVCLVSPGCAPSVKEYSLFDNHFSKAVENVLKNDICVSSARSTFTGAPSVAVDEALLAKAPGYRASTASPCGGRFLAERPRKYSNDSSSSLSSVRSCEDSPAAVTTSRMLPPSHRPRTSHQIPDLPCTSAFHTMHDLPPVCASSPFSDFSVEPAAESEPDSDTTPTTVAGLHAGSKLYSSPNEPMTLPRISTDLNPYAPDFVFRPMTQIPPVDSHSSSSSTTLADVPLLDTTTSGSFFIPNEMSAGRWNKAVAGMTGGETLAATAFGGISVPVMAVDVSPPQWTVPNNLLQESLTFG